MEKENDTRSSIITTKETTDLPEPSNVVDQEPPPVPPSLSQINFDSVAVSEGPVVPSSITGKKRKREEDDEPEVAIEERLQKRELLCILSKCKEKFPQQYEEVVGKRKVYNMPLNKLVDLVKEVKHNIGARTTSIVTDWGADLMLRGTENVLVKLGVECEGLSTVCGEDPEFQLIWNELMIDTMHTVFMQPKFRLGVHIAKTAYLLHTANKNFKATGETLNAPLLPKAQTSEASSKSDNSEAEEEEEYETSSSEEDDDDKAALKVL